MGLCTATIVAATKAIVLVNKRQYHFRVIFSALTAVKCAVWLSR